MTKELLEKITLIWLKENRAYNNKTFTEDEKAYMKIVPKFIWDYFNNDELCECGEKKRFLNLKKGYLKKCKKCNQKNRVKKTQSTMKEKYGYVSIFQDKEKHKEVLLKASSKESRNKAQATMIDNGTHQSSPLIIEKAKETKLSKYGYGGFNMEKVKETKLRKYGDEYFSNQQKASNTMIKKYNQSRYAKTKEFKDKYSGNNNSSRKHFLNLENFNREYIIEKFVSESGFDIISAIEYFGCTYNAFKDEDYYKDNISKIGRQVSDDMKGLFGNLFEYDTRSVIKPLELDMYSKDLNFAIEYNGLYWHSSKFKEKNYHLNKTELCEEKGIQLFHIFEDEWLDKVKRDIWISVIEGKQRKHTKIPARKCIINIPNKNEVNIFLEENHLQGSINAKLNYGLYFNGELVSLISLGLSRFSKKYEWELLRFASKKKTRVQGGFSKLLKHFEKLNNPISLVSYANRRWSQGNVYEKTGFVFSHNSKPNFWYLKNGKLESRLKYQKHKQKDVLDTFQESKTAEENMFLNGYLKIYDTGNKVYIKQYKDKQC